ncbi:hypothetical protein BLA29_008328 [Euroglyphus maynei]|uniref:Uncharacterized protein n=1 Tax=Euroglyphus maynei TaxID=6958 RepID=A0A1Y3APU0_EURMA|nr:hypothetical protein BLA29_008328 [Euroglyphus maynei]
MSVSFPPLMGQYMASILSNPQTFKELFSNITWDVHGSNDSNHLIMVKHWSTNHTNIYTNLIITILNTVGLMNVCMQFIYNITNGKIKLKIVLDVHSGIDNTSSKWIICAKYIGAAFGRLIGEIMAACFPGGISFSGYTIPIVPGGYSVVGMAIIIMFFTYKKEKT